MGTGKLKRANIEHFQGHLPLRIEEWESGCRRHWCHPLSHVWQTFINLCLITLFQSTSDFIGNSY